MQTLVGSVGGAGDVEAAKVQARLWVTGREEKGEEMVP